MNRTSNIDEALERLTRLETDGHRVLSLYLSLDPSDFPNLRERHMELDALLDDLERRHATEAQGPHAERIALREGIERVREFFTDAELAVPSARGLAIFCSVPIELFDVVSLPRGVPATAVLDARPFVEPLVELAAPERWCVLAISRRTSRILRGTREHLVEVDSVLDDVRGRHAQGGRSQARYQRGIETEVDEHIRSTCSNLYERFKGARFERLLVASPSELRHRVEHELHPDLSQRLAGHFEIDVERASPEEVRTRALPLIEADESRRERETLDRLEEGLAPNGHGATGLDEVLGLLAEARVQTLLFAHGFTAPGFACPQCGRLSVGALACPADGTTPEPVEDVIERAIELALRQSAEVLAVRHHPDALAQRGSIAALLRY
jgi:peptide chain release factor subunit 1